MRLVKKPVPALQFLGGQKSALRIVQWVNLQHNSYAVWYPADRFLNTDLTVWVKTEEGLTEVLDSFWVYFEDNQFKVCKNSYFKSNHRAIEE